MAVRAVLTHWYPKNDRLRQHSNKASDVRMPAGDTSERTPSGKVRG